MFADLLSRRLVYFYSICTFPEPGVLLSRFPSPLTRGDACGLFYSRVDGKNHPHAFRKQRRSSRLIVREPVGATMHPPQGGQIYGFFQSILSKFWEKKCRQLRNFIVTLRPKKTLLGILRARASCVKFFKPSLIFFYVNFWCNMFNFLGIPLVGRV